MLVRNYIELAIAVAVFLLGLVVFCIVRHNAARYESDLIIKSRDELRGRLD